jgi:hypothetical protein
LVNPVIDPKNNGLAAPYERLVLDAVIVKGAGVTKRFTLALTLL